MEEIRPLATAVVNANPDSKTSLLMKDKMNKVSTLASDTQTMYDDRLKALELETKEQRNEGTKERRNEETKKRRNEGTKERKNEVTKWGGGGK